MRSRFPLTALLTLLCVVSAQGQRPAPPKAQPAPVMEFFEVHEQSILDLQAAMQAKRVTSRGLVESYLARIQAYDQAGPRLNAIPKAGSCRISPRVSPENRY